MRLIFHGAIACAGLIALGAFLTIVPGAMAALRECKPLVVGEVSRSQTRRAARSDALASWMAKAKDAGIAHPAWRIALNKRLQCAAVGGGYDCVAVGQPCTIRQVPEPRRGIRPDGIQPRDI